MKKMSFVDEDNGKSMIMKNLKEFSTEALKSSNDLKHIALVYSY